MIHQVKYEKARGQLRDLLDAALRGETVFITRDEQSMVQLLPLRHAQQPRRFGSAKGMVVMSDDFDALLSDFTDYMP